MLEKWKARRDEILAAMEQIVSKEERSEANTKTLSDFEAELTVLTAQINDHTRFMEARAAADQVDSRQARAAVVRQRPTDPQERTFAEDFIASEQFRNYHFHGTSSQVEIETRAPITTTDAWAEGLFRPQQVNIAEPTISLPMFDLVTIEPVTTGSVEWVQYALNPNAAAVVAEGAVKPESGFAGTPGAATLDNWAHWVQVTRQALEDSQRLRSIIDTQMRNGVSRKVHDSISAALAAATLPTATGDDLLSAIRVGIATVQGAGFDPNAVLLNPADWASLDLTVMNATLSGPTSQTGFWGLRPVASPDQPAGTATVGDFKTGVRHFRRNAVSLYITDSHAETFISNVFTILAEQRAKTVVVNPNALVECAATPEPPVADGASRSGRTAASKAKS
jgi:HK97 family phage major capsid protein